MPATRDDVHAAAIAKICGPFAEAAGFHIEPTDIDVVISSREGGAKTIFIPPSDEYIDDKTLRHFTNTIMQALNERDDITPSSNGNMKGPATCFDFDILLNNIETITPL